MQVSKIMPLSAKPINSWMSIRKEYLGTHFVRSIMYGGDLIACVRFKALKREYLQHIRATIKTSLATGSALDLVGEGKLFSNCHFYEIEYSNLLIEHVCLIYFAICDMLTFLKN